MSANRLRDYLGHMLEAAQLAVSYVEGMEKTLFLQDKRTQQAVVLNIIIIGESASKLLNEHPEFLSQHSDVPWRSMKGMRNRVAHGYFDVDFEIVWQTVQTALPALAFALPAILAQAELFDGNNAT